MLHGCNVLCVGVRNFGSRNLHADFHERKTWIFVHYFFSSIFFFREVLTHKLKSTLMTHITFCNRFCRLVISTGNTYVDFIFYKYNPAVFLPEFQIVNYVEFNFSSEDTSGNKQCHLRDIIFETCSLDTVKQGRGVNETFALISIWRTGKYIEVLWPLSIDCAKILMVYNYVVDYVQFWLEFYNPWQSIGPLRC